MSWVLFFDGECAFCSAGVRRVARYDKYERLCFSSLQGRLAAEKGFTQHAADTGGTMVLLREEDGKVYTRSDALIELANILGGWWRLCTVAHFLPKSWRDRMYEWVADNRYRFMGKSSTCALPDPALLRRLRE